MGTMVETPFGPDVDEVPLPSAPLVFVVAQARFERIASIANEAFIAGFQEAIRSAYPVMRREQQTAVLLGPEGKVVPAEAGTAWRFEEQPGGWQVSLAPDFVALATSVYSSRSDFITRLRTVLSAAERELRVRFCERLGVRYVDRVTDENLLAKLPDLIRHEVLGAAGVPTGEEGVVQQHSFSDVTYILPAKTELHARWGLLPPKATFDPSIEPAELKSWVLDIDAYTTEQEAFSPEALTLRADALCRRVYRFFRWTVSEDFLVAHGGAS